MKKAVTLLLAGMVLALAGCASSTQQSNEIPLPGEATTSGLQVPPDAAERPVQTAVAPTR